MGRYNLFSVDHHEFESLCNDLIEVKLQTDVKRGKPGPDGGRDGTFTFDGGKRGVVQVKHYAADGYASLFRELKETELAKVARLKPDRYVLMTSCQLTDLAVFDRHLELHPDGKTLFYFDDFFGTNTLNALENNESSHVPESGVEGFGIIRLERALKHEA